MSGLAAALGLGVACEKRTADEQPAAPIAAAPERAPTPPPATPSASPTTPSSDMQPVSGSTLDYVTDDGKRTEIHDTVVLTQVQQKLTQEGLYSGPVDGHPSAELGTALRRYQARNGLPDTGSLDHATADKLGIDWDKLTKANVRDEVMKGASEAKEKANDVGDKIKDSTKDVTKEIKKDADKAKDDAKNLNK
jgi:peptidoglycan hydrolase-like protein with peptidoglycan-binding domain